MKNILFIILVLSALASCIGDKLNNEPLPKLGHRNIVNGDTIYHQVPEFSFINQFGETITNRSFSNQAYILDYFFTSCPTICPKVKRQELRLYEKYKDHPNLAFISVSIDPEYDDVERLSKFAKRLGIEKGNWHFVTGDKDMIYDNAVVFFHTAIENKDSPGGYDHDGKLVLIDHNRHIRGFCDGLIPSEVDNFFNDIENLLNEYK